MEKTSHLMGMLHLTHLHHLHQKEKYCSQNGLCPLAREQAQKKVFNCKCLCLSTWVLSKASTLCSGRTEFGRPAGGLRWSMLFFSHEPLESSCEFPLCSILGLSWKECLSSLMWSPCGGREICDRNVKIGMKAEWMGILVCKTPKRSNWQEWDRRDGRCWWHLGYFEK